MKLRHKLTKGRLFDTSEHEKSRDQELPR